MPNKTLNDLINAAEAHVAPFQIAGIGFDDAGEIVARWLVSDDGRSPALFYSRRDADQKAARLNAMPHAPGCTYIVQGSTEERS